MKYFPLVLCCTACLHSNAKVTLPEYFTDNMVIQQKSQLVVKGTSSKKSPVAITTSWDKVTRTASVDSNGKFRITVNTPKAGGPYTIQFDDGDKTEITNILSGEVWFCSGQSNMEMPISGWGKVQNYEQELKNANHPAIRLLQSKKVVSSTPSDHAVINMGWSECSTRSAENFSAVAYFFARQLQAVLKVPIGVIDSSWGGTPAEAWTSIGALKNVYDMQDYATAIAAAHGDEHMISAIYQEVLSKWEKAYYASDKGYADGKPRWVNDEQTSPEWRVMPLPGQWEGLGLPDFDGCVWFQRTVDIPKEWENKPLTLNVGKVDDNDITFFNGEKIGATDGYWINRSYTVPKHLAKSGKAIITIRVQDNSGGGGIYGDKSELSLCCGDQSISLCGDWKYNIGAKLADQPQRPKEPTHPNFPANLYNAMVYPFRDFTIKGVIWYQGEENSARWKQYTPLFQTLISDWRRLWKCNLPFYFVQLANWQASKQVQPESAWAHLREAQANALQVNGTNMAVTIDIGEAYDIHPKNKQEVGRRLALAALSDTYKHGKYHVTHFNGMHINGNTATISFSQNLKTQDNGEVKGFVMAGPDMIFHEAEAKIIGNKAIVTCKDVATPIAVRYAWADNPQNNLQGIDGLPVAPFRTDRFDY